MKMRSVGIGFLGLATAALLASAIAAPAAAGKGWCCRDGVLVAATPAQCREKGGAWFAVKADAERFCPPKGRLPDLRIRDILLDRACRVVVVAANAGPGAVPDAAWTVRAPAGCAVYLYVNGRRWGSRAVRDFDPGRALLPAGGTASWFTTLMVGIETEITAVIDHTGEVAEADEENNRLVRRLKCPGIPPAGG